jgi:4-amino-4-deoxy-L-arabinose transferase-like glycosyltransferase
LWTALLNLVASVATCLLVFSSAKLLTRNVAASFYAAIFVTLDPWLIWFVKNPMTTVTATFFVALAVYFFVQLIEGRRLLVSSVALGASCALAALDHPALIVISAGFTLAILIVVAGSWKNKENFLGFSNSALSLAVMWLSFLIVLTPYAVRNYRDVGRPVLISDGAGLSYFMGATRYSLSPYPWANVQWPFTDVADRLHVSVSDLDAQYFTIDDRYYPELSRLAKADIESLAIHHPGYLAKRTAVMGFWFLAGDYSVSRTLAHCIFLALIAIGCWVCWRTYGWKLTAPFLAIMLPGLSLHSLTMALIGHAAYAIPYVVPLAIPLAFAFVKEPVPATTFYPASKTQREVYGVE